jgi:Protein of unknown function DUF2617
MLANITASYADTRAADLSWSIGEAPRAGLASLQVGHGHLRLDLRVLGASHQAVLDTPAGRCAEIVACRPGAPAGLPAEVVEELPGLRYAFRARVRQLPAEELAAAVARLRARLRAHPWAILGVFPGADNAVTALQADHERGGIGWRTWHAYPQTGELVLTRTRATPQ